jgi:hypothetical protein
MRHAFWIFIAVLLVSISAPSGLAQTPVNLNVQGPDGSSLTFELPTTLSIYFDLHCGPMTSRISGPIPGGYIVQQMPANTVSFAQYFSFTLSMISNGAEGYFYFYIGRPDGSGLATNVFVLPFCAHCTLTLSGTGNSVDGTPVNLTSPNAEILIGNDGGLSSGTINLLAGGTVTVFEPTPEPATSSLMLIGIVSGVLVMLKRKA